ncbi:MAG TPA: hypothetical protein PK948_12410, partial [Gemmatimonadales bacterium]|nr:hypothetical protein [Gemmatimonadales bacterium]
VNHQLYIGSAFTLSPDGRRIAYVAQSPGSPSRLMLRDLGDSVPRAFPGTDGADGPFFSPDGTWIAYSSGLKLYKVPTAGGAPILLASGLTDALANGAWSTDGKIYYSDQSYALAAVPEDGGTPVTIVKPENRAVAFISPTILPRKDALLVTACNNNCTLIHLMGLNLRTGALDTVLTGGSRGWYLPDGRLLVTRQDGTVVAAPFDLKTLRLTEPPTVVLTGVQMELSITPELTVADNGTLVYLTSNQQGTSATVARVDRTGRAAILDSAWTDLFSSIALSPDGTRLAVSTAAGPASALWVKQLDRGPLTRLSFEGTLNYRPAWRPGGRMLSFTSDRDSSLSYLYEIRADGSGRPARLLPQDTSQVDEAVWSSDGEWLVYRTGVSAGLRDIWARRVRGDSAPFPVAAGEYDEYMPALSPDGKWVAYVSVESGREDVYVRPFPDADRARWQVSTAGGHSPAWNPTSRELLFVSAADSLMSLPYADAAGEFRTAGGRGVLSTRPFLLLPFHRSWEVSPDGRSFLFLQRSAAVGSEASRLTVVLNWFEELGGGR